MTQELDPYLELENYIETKEPQGFLENQCFSPSFYQSKKNAYETTKLSLKPKLCFFASNGYRSYFYYKSSNANLYLIEFFLGEIYDYCKINIEN